MEDFTKKEPREIVKELVSRYIPAKPTKISLKLNWNEKRSLINLKGDNLDQTAEYFDTIDFTSFAHGVVDAYRGVYGDLEVIPISFREEVYRNDKVALDLYPTGSAGIFDIYIEYKRARGCSRFIL
jgi:hypothetical protein